LARQNGIRGDRATDVWFRVRGAMAPREMLNTDLAGIATDIWC
jgi:hypothetical protein